MGNDSSVFVARMRANWELCVEEESMWKFNRWLKLSPKRMLVVLQEYRSKHRAVIPDMLSPGT